MFNSFKFYLVLIGLLAYLPHSQANQKIDREDQLKAVYLYHFADLTRWPAQSLKKNINICIFENSTVKPYLKELSKELVNGKNITLISIKKLEQPQFCQIIYFDQNTQSVPEQNTLPVEPGTLLVGNNQSFIDIGGAISFINKDNKIKLLINLKQIRLSGLDISSKLLRISGIVE